MQVIRLAQIGMTRFVADDDNINAPLNSLGKELQNTRKCCRFIHSGAVNIPLKFSPVVFAIAAPQVVSYKLFVYRDISRNQLPFTGQTMEKFIVSHNSVIKI